MLIIDDGIDGIWHMMHVIFCILITNKTFGISIIAYRNVDVEQTQNDLDCQFL
jgi:hypothetical protein